MMRKPNPDRRQNGFSLLELLIVVTIIGILASIAIPRLLTSRRAANEASAQSSLRTIHSIQASYQNTLGSGEFGDLAALVSNNLLDPSLGSGTKSGYTFVIDPSAAGVRPSAYYATAAPTTTSGLGQTGSRIFAISEDGVMRGEVGVVPYSDWNAVQAAPPLNN